MVTCPLVPSVPNLISDSCSSPRAFGLDFLQNPPRDDAFVLLLSFGSANTWCRYLHPASSVPCLAHTLKLTCQIAYNEIDIMYKTFNFPTEFKLKQGGLVRLNFSLCNLIIILNGQHKRCAGPNV